LFPVGSHVPAGASDAAAPRGGNSSGGPGPGSGVLAGFLDQTQPPQQELIVTTVRSWPRAISTGTGQKKKTTVKNTGK